MKLRFAIAAIVLSSLLASARAADTYSIDPVHSSIIFRAQHVNAGYVFGRFNSFSGTIVVDDDPGKMSFNVNVQVDSLDSAQPKRDGHLKSPDFFSAKEFPTISFKSSSVKSAGDGKYEVTGEMKLHGQSKPITVTVSRTGQSETPQFGKRMGFLSTFTVKRSDFGMNAMTNMVSDEIELTAAFEAVKK